MKNLKYNEFNSLKILHHIDRLKALAQGNDIAPVTVEIDPVAYCNHACAWCVDPGHYPYKLNLETYEKLICELANFSVNQFAIEGIVFKGGGEPTLHPDFEKMLIQASHLNFSIGVVTNGSRLQKYSKSMALHTAYVRVSIDGPTAESHYAIHKRKDFEKIISGVKSLIAARGEARHPIIGLSFAMDIHTYQLADAAIALGENLAVDYILIRPPFFEEVGSNPTMSVAQAQEVRSYLQTVAQQYSGPLNIMAGNWISDSEQALSEKKSVTENSRRDLQVCDARPIEHKTKRCLASPVLAVITADGSVYGCCNLRALTPWSFGRLDYSNHIGFTEIWLGKKRQEKLKNMHQTQCIKHCTHPLSKYNEMIEVLRDTNKFHSQFV